jgi:chromosomal replication initiator protein
VATDDKDIVSVLRAALADRVGKERFELWFGANVRLELADAALTISVPNRFFSDFLRINFRRHLQAASTETLGRSIEIEFRVDRALPDPHAALPESRSSARSQPAKAESDPLTTETPLFDRARKQQHTGSRRRPFKDLESYVVGPTNRLAHAAAEMVVRQPGDLSPLLVHGPTGVGKTHLLEGIWTASRKTGRGPTAIYLSAERFATGFLQALRGGGLPSFRRKYRGVDLLILDDLQFLCGKKYTQVELLYTIDSLVRDGRQLVLAGDRPPREMGDLGPELATRLESGMVSRIEPPDRPTRLGIVMQMARGMRLSVPPEVAEYVASHLTRHARELSGALCRLKATSQAAGKPITIGMAEEALVDLVRSSTRVVGLADIEKAVCNTFDLGPRALQSDCRSRGVSYPRMLAMWLARKYTRSALSEIGQHFGRRSHATVISAQKRVDSWRSADSSIQLANHTWKVNDAIRQVERSLQAG